MEGCIPILGKVIKGKVTKVNTFMLFFEVDSTYRVYTDWTKVPADLPCLHDNVEVINPKAYKESTFTALIGPKSVCNYSGCLSETGSNTFQEFLVTHKIAGDVDDLFAIDHMVRKLELFITDHSVQLCIATLFKYLGKSINEGTLKRNIIYTPKDLHLNYANSNSQLYEFLNFDGQCAFNVYHNNRTEKVGECASDCLFGILETTESHGYFILRDDTSRVLVKFMISHDDLYKLNNCVVLITKYLVFNETYPDRMQAPLLYILLNVDNVIVVTSCIKEGEAKSYYGKNDECVIERKRSYFFQPIKISEIIYGYDKSPECWLEAMISHQITFVQPEHIYAILPKELVKIALFLKENVVYKVFTDQIWKCGDITKYKELYGMRGSKKIIHLTPDSVFKETEFPIIGSPVEVVEDFQSIKSHMANLGNLSMFSFILKIDRKKYQHKTYASWFPQRHANLTHFGDFGDYQEKLIFRDASTQTFIDLYLTNRENHVVPLGLIPNMKVKVNHVQVNKGKYLKTTIFTSFQIIDYCPEVRFSCVNMLFRDKKWWWWRTKSETTLLGVYAFIPANCIVYGLALFRGMLSLRLEVVCRGCKRISSDENCHRCNIKEKFVDTRMIINAQDPVNPACYIEINNVDFLLVLVGLNKQGRAAFFEECVRTNIRLDIDFVKFSDNHLNYVAESNPILHRLVTLIRSSMNYKSYLLLTVVCIRQFIEGRTPWQLIDFEFLSKLY